MLFKSRSQNANVSCNHGTYRNSTCWCDDGWRTDPAQDAFNTVFCNQSVYDADYYGESALRERSTWVVNTFFIVTGVTLAAACGLTYGVRCLCKGKFKHTPQFAEIPPSGAPQLPDFDDIEMQSVDGDDGEDSELSLIHI